MTEGEFKKTIHTFYRKNRRDLPWRTKKGKTKIDPYHVIVSEFMLQQTQVSRVIPKFEVFIKKFPTIETLARAPLRNVISLWQGLGYNRRAKFLHESAKVIVNNHKGIIPRNIDDLESLPGVGPYIARAVSTFAYNQPEVFIETNIRTVFIHEFFSRPARGGVPVGGGGGSKKGIHDKEILGYVTTTLDQKNPREWYYALMDYGSHLKREGKDANARSVHYVKQSKFQGSDRQIRGQILKQLVDKKHISLPGLQKLIGGDSGRLQVQLKNLVYEKLVTKQGNFYKI